MALSKAESAERDRVFGALRRQPELGSVCVTRLVWNMEEYEVELGISTDYDSIGPNRQDSNLFIRCAKHLATGGTYDWASANMAVVLNKLPKYWRQIGRLV